jgi:pilus assembly protein Flp/PilA
VCHRIGDRARTALRRSSSLPVPLSYFAADLRRAQSAHRPVPAGIRGENIVKLMLFNRDDELGQGLAEYALILALIAIVAIAALIFMGGQVAAILSQVGANI